MLNTRVLLQNPGTITHRLAAITVRTRSKRLILGFCAVIALALAACAGAPDAPTSHLDFSDGDVGGATYGVQDGTASVSALAASATPASRFLTGTPVPLDYGPAQEFDQVALTFGKAIEDDPYDSAAYNGRAAAYVSLGRFRSAIVDLDQVIRLDAENFRAYTIRAGAYEGLEEWRAAVDDYDRAIRIDPGHVDAYFNRANFFLRLELPHLAIEDLNEAIRLDSEFVDGFLNRGSAYERLGRLQRAAEDYRTAAFPIQSNRTSTEDRRTLRWGRFQRQ